MWLGLSGDALLAGMTLRDCFALHALHMPDLQRGVEMAVVERGGQAHWVHGMREADPEAAGHLTEGIAAFVIGAIRAILGDPEAKLLVAFPHWPLAPMRRCIARLPSARAAISRSPSTRACSIGGTRSCRWGRSCPRAGRVPGASSVRSRARRRCAGS
jgi:hypothetical protein